MIGLITIINTNISKYLSTLDKYDTEPNCHHRQTIQIHALWTGRQAERFLRENVYDLTAGMDDRWKLLTLCGAIYHDIGKDDGKYNILSKPEHPYKGYKHILKPKEHKTRSFKLLDKLCSNIDIQNYFKMSYKELCNWFAILSLYHRKLGDIFQQKIDEYEYVRGFIQLCIRYGFTKPSFIKKFMFSVLIVSMSDVLGAWRVPILLDSILPILRDPYYEFATNRFVGCPDENVDCTKVCEHPWFKYGYHKETFELMLKKLKFYIEDFVNINK